MIFHPLDFVEAPPLVPARGRGALELGGGAVVSAAFAASLGFNFGIGNQLSYLLPSLRLLDPTLLARDWFATETTLYHPLFTRLGALLLALDRHGGAVALTFTLLVTLSGLVLYALCRTLAGPRAGLAAFLLTMALAFVTRTAGPAVTYVFDATLQPSTLSSAFFLAAAASFAAGRSGLSGVLLGVSGLWHVNLLLLSAPAFGIGQLLLGRRGLGRRLLWQLTPSLGACLWFSPMLLAALAPVPHADLARHVFMAIRAPHHFVIRNQLLAFLPLAGWQLVATGLVLPLVRTPEHAPFARFSALLGGTLAVVWLGTLGGLASPRAANLFAWRLAPHAELMLELLSAAAAVRALLEPTLLARASRAAKTTVLVGLVLLLVVYFSRDDRRPGMVLLAAAALFATWSRTRMKQAGPGLLAALGGVLLCYFAVGPLRRIPSHSSLFAPRPQALLGLEFWLRERSPKQALLLTPPDEESLRFWGERAIVVDWKGAPALPREVLEWYRRLGDVLGRPAPQGVDALEGYRTLDAERVEALRKSYGIDFVVVRRAQAEGLRVYPRAFENSGYVVLRVTPR